MLNMRVFGKKLATFSLVLLFLGTTLVSATEQSTLVTGHVTWTDIGGYDNCKAAVAGLASSRVLWFDDSVLIDNYDLGNTWVYATEADAPDPRGRTLAYNRSYVFDDPNGWIWNVSEYQYFASPGASADGDADPYTSSAAMDSDLEARAHARAGPYYTWVVKLLPAPEIDRHPGPDQHSRYNFVLIVDTCKFLRMSQNHTDIGRGKYDPTVEHGEHVNDPNGSGQHAHELFLANLMLGGAPDERGILVPVGQPGADRYHSLQNEHREETYGYTP